MRALEEQRRKLTVGKSVHDKRILKSRRFHYDISRDILCRSEFRAGDPYHFILGIGI